MKTIKELELDAKVCVLCGAVQTIKPNGKKKLYPKHHIDYKKDITIQLCFPCHQAVHCRLRWGSAWEKKYGKDKGFYELCKAFLAIYEQEMGLKENKRLIS